jgi:cytidylate kinase
MNTNLIIAIDGPAASGKGTLSRSLADVLILAHLDTGALYRAVAFEVLEAQGDPMNPKDALKGAETLMKRVAQAGDASGILANPLLRSNDVGTAASKVATLTAVRAKLIHFQKDFAANPAPPFQGAVLDGRDIGTVICPDAPVKLFITASDTVRAERRLKELQSRGIQSTYEAVLTDLRARDARDQSRSTAPLKAADDAVTLDTSGLDATQTLNKALEIIEKKGFSIPTPSPC